MRHGQDGHGAFPPSARVDVVSLAPRKPPEGSGPATRWRMHERVAARRHQPSAPAMSRSTIWRMLEDADLKPHRRVYGLTRHAPDCDTQARDIWHLSGSAFRFSHEGRVVICVDDKTGRQRLQRKSPPHGAQPGQPAQRAQESIRHGVRGLRASLGVPTGQGLGHLGMTRTREECVAPLQTVGTHLPEMARYAWGLENLKPPWRLEVCRLGASWGAFPWTPKALERGPQRRAVLSDPTPPPVFQVTPLQGAWLTHVEWWCRV